jgi:hypothetical protein
MKLRFSIRDLLWLTLVVALCVGWWLNHQSHLNAAAKAKKEHGYELTAAKELLEDLSTSIDLQKDIVLKRLYRDGDPDVKRLYQQDGDPNWVP